MKKLETEFSSSRRDTLKKLALGSTAGLFGMFEVPLQMHKNRLHLKVTKPACRP
jgi:hypothetical protein